jgi:hypothetical protein
MAGLVPAIPIKTVKRCPWYREARHKGTRPGTTPSVGAKTAKDLGLLAESPAGIGIAGLAGLEGLESPAG